MSQGWHRSCNTILSDIFSWFLVVWPSITTGWAQKTERVSKGKTTGLESWNIIWQVKNDPTLTQVLQYHFFWYFQLIFCCLTGLAQKNRVGLKRKNNRRKKLEYYLTCQKWANVNVGPNSKMTNQSGCINGKHQSQKLRLLNDGSKW